MSTIANLIRFSAVTGSILLTAQAASAAPPSKEECVDSFGKGQDARESGQLTQAAKLFLACAQSTCPTLVQSDCARLADEVVRLQPSVTFAARDSAQADLPDTAVYVDGALVASRLGDGKAHDLDPGKHEVRFVHAGKETTVTLVLNQGEKGRGVVGTFASPTSSPAATPAPVSVAAPEPPKPDEPTLKRGAGPLVLVGLGAAAAVTGGVLLGVGLGRIPASCSLATKDCAAPPGDPALTQASKGVSLANVGGIVGGAGVAALAGSLIWYFAQTPRLVDAAPATSARSVTPWLGPKTAGLSLSSSF